MNVDLYSELLTRGLTYPFNCTYEWLTERAKYANMTEQTNQRYPEPIRHWQINMLLISDSNRAKLLEYFNRAAGRHREFIFLDPKEYLCTYTDWSSTLIAAQTIVQLQKTYYIGTSEAWTENKTKIVPSTIYPPTIKVDGVAAVEGAGADAGHYTLDDTTGILTFGAAPGAGKVVTADYKFYFRGKFETDLLSDSLSSPDFWRVESIPLVEVK